MPPAPLVQKQTRCLRELGTKMRERIEEKLEHGVPLTIADGTWLCKELRELQEFADELAVASGIALTGLKRFATNFTGTVTLNEALKKYQKRTRA